MKKKLLSVSFALLFAVFCIAGVLAKSSLLVDDAELLSEDEYSYILELLESAGSSQDASFVIITTYLTGGETIREYADDTMDYGGYEYDCILLLVDMERMEYYISTGGKYNNDYVNIEVLDDMENDIIPHLQNRDFFSAFQDFANHCMTVDLDGADNYNGYYNYNDYDNDYDREPFGWFPAILTSLAVGALAAFITTSVMRGQLKNVKAETRAANYVVSGSMNVTESRDLFLYHHISRRPKPKSNSGSGGSSHRSSSGRSHGGRGGSFR